MPNEIYENIIENQNNFITARTAEINELKENTATVLATLSALSNRVYSYAHTAVVTDSLDAVYNNIITENDELAVLSAVGFTALLRSGDTVPVQGNRVFINGTEAQTDYTFSGENSQGGVELVNVWCFENDSTLEIGKTDIEITAIVIKDKSASVVVDNSFVDFCPNVKTNSVLPASLNSIKILADERGGVFNGVFPASIKVFKSNAVTYNPSDALKGRTSLNKAYFPFLQSIRGGTTSGGNSTLNTFLNGCKNCQTVDFPMLKEITNATSSSGSPFRDVPNIVLPETVNTIGAYAFYLNKTIILNCKDAEIIADNWCATTPSEVFGMCSDWGASINIATAAANWSKADFIDLFQNKLRDMGEDVKEIKIPSAIYDSLTDEEFEIAENKGWTIGA